MTAYQRMVKFLQDKCDSSGEQMYAAKLLDAVVAEVNAEAFRPRLGTPVDAAPDAAGAHKP